MHAILRLNVNVNKEASENVNLLPNKDGTDENANDKNDGGESDDCRRLQGRSTVVVCVYLLKKRKTNVS